MAKILAAGQRSDAEEADLEPGGGAAARSDDDAAGIVVRARRLMIISGLTTLIAIAAVIGAIGYRVFRSGGAEPMSDKTVVLPRGAVVISTAVAEGRIIVMFDAGGATEIRTFDVKTLKEAGRIKFATEP